ncbi:MAG: type VII toxin-antitoxin system MntA family adenylyltransferase antitoxin, partial [Candidatus Natronoplasma sp.]
GNELPQEEKEKIKSKIIDHLQEEGKVSFAYLHGSFLKGRFNDIDIGVYLKEEFSEKELIEFEMSKGVELSRKLGYEVDLRVLNRRKIVFLHQVLKNGELLVCSDEKKRVEFESKVYSEYLDIKYYLGQYNELRRKRILA